MNPHLSIVIPAYNEEKNYLGGVLDPSFEFLNKQKYSWDIIFVNDGSTDKTEILLKKLCQKNKHCHLITIPHGGRAAAMKVGMIAAQGKYILYTDFDQSTALSEVAKFLELIQNKKYDIVIGARGYGKTQRKDSLSNKIRAKTFVIIAKLWMGLSVMDINCGFKLYQKTAAHKIFSSLLVSRPLNIKHAYMGAIDTEIIFLAKKYHFKIAQLPVNWERRPFVSHINVVQEVTTILKDIFLMRLYDWSGRYNYREVR